MKEQKQELLFDSRSEDAEKEVLPRWNANKQMKKRRESEMFIPKWLLEKMMREAQDHERRIRRLEDILYQNSKNTITSLQSRKAGVDANMLFGISGKRVAKERNNSIGGEKNEIYRDN